MRVARARQKAATKDGYHHGDLPRALIAAAERMIEKEGPAKLTLREAARVAGVSVAAPYRHFADKQALVAAVLTKGFVELTRTTEEARGRARTPLTALSAVGVAYVKFAAAHPSIYRLMFGPGTEKAQHPELLAAGKDALGVVVSAVRTCQESGDIAAGNTEQLALAGWAICHGLASLHADGALASVLPVDIEQTAKAIIKMLLDGIARKATT